MINKGAVTKKNVFDRLDNVNEQVGNVVSLLVIALMGIITFEVVSRYAFNAPTLWASDTCSYIQAVYYILGGGYALLHGLHVRIDIFYDRFSPKTRLLINLTIGSILFYAFGIILLWKTSEFAITSVIMRETAKSGLWAGPVYPYKLLMPVGAFLIMFQWTLNLIRDIGNLRKQQ